jgi:hypothetical protein
LLCFAFSTRLLRRLVHNRSDNNWRGFSSRKAKAETGKTAALSLVTFDD